MTMRRGWKTCAAAILISGSISSTSGAADCAVPADAEAALAARVAGDGPPYPYREELRHPAMPAPSVSRGVMEIGADGALIRRQSAPRRETATIRGDYLHITAPATGPEAPEESRILPIPPAMRPMLTTLRAIVRREAPDLDGAVLTGDGAGWRLDIPVPEAALRLFGCGDRLDALELAPARGVRRKIVFEAR